MTSAAPGVGRRLLSRPLLFPAIVLFAVNAIICHRLFVTEYTGHLGSIEAAYIGISRYVIEHAGELTWFPLWYGGIPFQNTYPPLLHMVVAAVAWVLHISPALAHHIVTALFYCFGPVTLFLLAYKLSNNRALSFAAGLMHSLLSPSAFLMRSVAFDLESVWGLRRLQTLVAYGDGPHVASIALLPLGVIALHVALSRWGPIRVLLAALALASVVLTNWLGAFALAMAALSYLLARSDEPGWLWTVARSGVIGILAYAIASPWIPPSTIDDIQRNAQYFIGKYPMGPQHIGYAAALIVAVVLLRWLLSKRRAGLALRFGLYFLLFMGAITLSWEFFELNLMPQPDRYHLELEMAICLVAVFLLGRYWMLIPSHRRAWAMGALAVLCLIQAGNHVRFARRMIGPIAMEQTVDYQVSEWLDRAMPGERVFETGSVQFWLNAFADNPQIGGGFGQGVVNPMIPVVHFGIPYTESDGVNTAKWLRLYGANAVVVSGPEGRDFYRHNWRDPEKFRGVLPEIWRDGGEVIYRVPRRSSSLAHVILPEHVVKRPPVNALDLEPVEALDAALEDPSLPLAGFSWIHPHEAVISARVKPEHLYFVQITYHPGWSAFAGGRKCPIRKDGLGFMVIEPKCGEGPCEVLLRYDGGLEMKLCKLASGLGFFWTGIWLMYSRRRNAGRSDSRRGAKDRAGEAPVFRAAIRIRSTGRRLLSHPLLMPAIVLFATNAVVCHRLFFTEYTQHRGSIEAAYFALSRYIIEHVGELTWFPLWYCGIPFQNTYSPLLHLVVAGAAAGLHISTALAHHAVTALFYSFGPVTLFLLAYKLSNNRAVGFAAALMHSLVSPSAFLMESVALDLQSVWWPRRLQTLVAYGDGPHIASIALLPIGVMALHAALNRWGPIRVLGAALALAAIVLTNWLGAFALAMAVLSYLLARSDEPGWLRTVARSAVIGILAYAMASPWIPPSTVGDIQGNAQYYIGSYPLGPQHLGYAALLLLTVVLLRWLLGKRKTALGLRFGLYFLLFMGAITLSWEFFDLNLMPQPHRYHLELEMAICLVVAFLLGRLWQSVPSRRRAWALGALLVLCLIQAANHVRFARLLIRPIPIEQTVDYQVSAWLDRELPGQRVFATGSLRFWLNAFSDNPQVAGGLSIGVVNRMLWVVHFGIPFTEGDGVTAAKWLRLFGANAVVVSGPDGGDFYKNEWRDPGKFRGVLPEIWRDGGDSVYKVPRRSSSLAHVILPKDVVTRSPINVLDLEPVEALDAALEDPSLPLAEFSWIDPHEAVISGHLKPEHLYFVQISYHPGWSAFAGGRECPIREDGLGFMVIEPKCGEGPCEVRLRYDGGLEMKLCNLASALGFFSVGIWFVRSQRRGRA